ncbi:MAG: hypothetical protein NVSMB29_11900 [Candidatus Dormibacteria bacterium]
MLRALHVLLAGAALVILAACDSGDIPGAPASSAAVSPAGHRAPNAYLLRVDQLVGYKRGGAQNVDPGTLADQENLPSLKEELRRQGFDSGARERFVDPGRDGPTQPFATIYSQALFFHDQAGAGAFFAAEGRRRDVPPAAGTLTPLTALPSTGAEQFLALEVDAPASAGTGGPQRAFLALMRRGSLVIDLFSQGDPATATVENFRALVVAQEKQLQQPV